MKKLFKKPLLIIFFISILTGLTLSFFSNLTQPQVPQVKAATASSGTITITNSGSEQSSYDVLVSVDTASLISGGTMQSDCDDIRLYDSDDTTPLNYWIESGCNTATTQLWVTVPTVPNGTKDIYLHYNDSEMANGEQSWSGNFVLLNDEACPAGWTRATAWDSRFPYGASSYGGTGGASTHSHSAKTITSNGPSGSTHCQQTQEDPMPHESHTHTLRITGNSTSALPSYRNMVYCQKTDLDIDSGLIALFDASVPSGWTRFTALDSRFPYGASSYGSTGGSSTHNHTIVHSNVSGPTGSYNRMELSSGVKISLNNHVHTWDNVTSGSTAHTPSYRNMVFGSKDATGVGEPDMISMFTALPPLGWTRFTALDSRFPQGASSYGGTGGNTSHTHTASKTSSYPTVYWYAWTQAYQWYCQIRHEHTHSYSTSTNSASHLPPYRNTIFGKRNDPVGAGITTTVEFDNSCEATLDDTSHTIKSNCSFENTLAGMDPGTGTENTSTLILESGILTINNGYTVVAGSYNFTGGSIALADTGAQFIIDGVIYYSDADADGYPSSTTTEVAFTTPANKHRRNVLTSLVSLDCNDSNDTIYQNLDGYMDSDGDNHGTGDLTPICSGETLPDGYTTADNVDCNDSNDTLYQNLDGYVDSDGDDYGTGNLVSVCSGAVLPDNYAVVAGDCNDSNANLNTSCQKCSGGTETTSGGDRIHKFTSSSTLICNQSVTVTYLVVAGGGGGGGSQSGWGGTGGGGGGGYRTGTLGISATSYPVTVGNGGSGSSSAGIAGSNGSNSIFSSITSTGGGGGGGYKSGAYTGQGSSGGSGGGGGGQGGNPGSGISGQGYGGGNGAILPYDGGGGGGAGASGRAAKTSDGGGGDGLASSITGSSIYYAGGGDGTYGGNGGLGGGGYFSYGGGGAPNGVTNTGGGGAGTYAAWNGGGGNGGSGIVIIRYTE